jgi:hypothetical protein
VPVSGTLCGLPAALSAIRSDAVRAPVAVGVKVTFTVQLPPAATGAARQVLELMAKSPGLVPARVRLLIDSGALPVLLTVTVRAAAVVLVVWFPNATPAAAVGLVVTAGSRRGADADELTANCSRSIRQRMSQPSPFTASWIAAAPPAAAAAASATDAISQTVIDRRRLPRSCTPTGAHEVRRVDVGRPALFDDLADDHEIARVDLAGEHVLLQRGPSRVTRRVVQVLVLHQIGRADLGRRVGRVCANADAHAQLLVAVDDVVALATRKRVAAGTAELDVTLAPERAAERAPSTGREGHDRGGGGVRLVRRIDIRLCAR